MKKKKILAAIAAVLVLGAAAAYFILKPRQTPTADVQSEITALVNAQKQSAGRDVISNAAVGALKCVLTGDADVHYRRAVQTVTVTRLDVDALTTDLSAQMQEKLSLYVENAYEISDVYDENRSFLPRVVDNAYSSVIMARLKNKSEYLKSQTLELKLKYSGGQWHIVNRDELASALDITISGRPGYDAAVQELTYIPFHYILDDWTSPAPAPDPSCYGETDDPSVVSALLESETALRLINNQRTDWSADKPFIPGSMINYYLDESLLAITWQEDVNGTVGTFSEVFINDGSQLRRKLAGDIFACYEFYTPTTLSAQSNAVVAVSGDYYDVPDTVNGIYAYNGKARWCNLTQGQTCFFNADGDMIFAFESQFANEYAVQRYIDDNRIMFSVSYGPVLIQNGVDITPAEYFLGDINGSYARACIGQLGERHYLAMTLNVQTPDYPNYVTVKQAAETMLSHGCIQAYNLKGGQNASIVMNNRLMNPVQFGQERYMSDIFYFGSAIKK